MKKMVSSRRVNGYQITTIVSRRSSDNTVGAIQTDAFSQQQIIDETIEIAYMLPETFWYSDLRSRCSIALPDSEHGRIGRRLCSSGDFVKTGRYRPSPIKSRRGGIEAEYKRIATQRMK